MVKVFASPLVYIYEVVDVIHLKGISEMANQVVPHIFSSEIQKHLRGLFRLGQFGYHRYYGNDHHWEWKKNKKDHEMKVIISAGR